MYRNRVDKDFKSEQDIVVVYCNNGLRDNYEAEKADFFFMGVGVNGFKSLNQQQINYIKGELINLEV